MLLYKKLLRMTFGTTLVYIPIGIEQVGVCNLKDTQQRIKFYG